MVTINLSNLSNDKLVARCTDSIYLRSERSQLEIKKRYVLKKNKVKLNT